MIEHIYRDLKFTKVKKIDELKNILKISNTPYDKEIDIDKVYLVYQNEILITITGYRTMYELQNRYKVNLYDYINILKWKSKKKLIDYDDNYFKDKFKIIYNDFKYGHLKYETAKNILLTHQWSIKEYKYLLKLVTKKDSEKFFLSKDEEQTFLKDYLFNNKLDIKNIKRINKFKTKIKNIKEHKMIQRAKNCDLIIYSKDYTVGLKIFDYGLHVLSYGCKLKSIEIQNIAKKNDIFMYENDNLAKKIYDYEVTNKGVYKLFKDIVEVYTIKDNFQNGTNDSIIEMQGFDDQSQFKIDYINNFDKIDRDNLLNNYKFIVSKKMKHHNDLDYMIKIIIYLDKYEFEYSGDLIAVLLKIKVNSNFEQSKLFKIEEILKNDFEYKLKVKIEIIIDNDIEDDYINADVSCAYGYPNGEFKEVTLENIGIFDAEVVITNPTHYVVALKYDKEQTDAP
ncbi:EscU/YscU/HrcU family type III secretion system export apparatus switch protein, partial [Poseidonibacter sp.]|uniref:EscU/YscU/HrcU family type III secretion system export apparatus switch protein n=1 Tax=Poseidonibacter sp. TaxID=2321188 RepID=UPI003C784610